MNWKELKYWKSGEFQVVEERLADLTAAGIPFCPAKRNLFRALSLTPLDSVRVVVLGQDPYPDPEFGTGVAFSVSNGSPFPRTLSTIFKEYVDDLHYEMPTSGNLEPWCSRGVLLWNVYPSCEAYKSSSHHWEEWEPLTKEILEYVTGNNRGDKPSAVVTAFGSTASRSLAHCSTGAEKISVSHPSPRGQINAKTPFLGSRVFTHINDCLCKTKQEPINWRL